MVSIFKRPLDLLPVLGVAVFVSLYFAAASQYPGGTRIDAAAQGYDHLRNFWCDLMHPIAFDGEVNRGRPYALAGTVLLPLALIQFWYRLPVLFLSRQRRLRRLVRISGCSAMAMAMFMPLAHDLVIDAASLSVFIAFGASLWGLLRNQQRALIVVACFAMLLCVANFSMWQMSYRLDLMPIVQKAAFVLSLFFVCIATVRCARTK